MAPNKFATMLHRNTHKIIVILVYAALEWFLIFLLLLNSLFTYLIAKYACYFGLKQPCIWCSRVDHILESRKGSKEFSYRELVCENHAAEIAKLSYCGSHRKLVELENMCVDCSASCLDQDDNEIMRRSINFVTRVGEERLEKESGNSIGVCSCCEKGLVGKIYPDYFLLKESSWGALEYKENGGLIVEMIEEDKTGEGYGGARESDCSAYQNEEDQSGNGKSKREEEQHNGEVLSDVESYGLSLREVSEEDGSRSISTNYLGNDEEMIEIHPFTHQLCFGLKDDSLRVIDLCGHDEVVDRDTGHLIPVELIDSSTLANRGSIDVKVEDLRKEDHRTRDAVFSEMETGQAKQSDEHREAAHEEEIDGSGFLDEHARTKAEIVRENSDREIDSCQDEAGECESSLLENASEVTSPPLSGANQAEQECQDEENKVSNDKSQEQEEEKLPETPTSLESLTYLHKKMLLFDKRESVAEESVDGSMVSEMDGGDPQLTIERLRATVKAERDALRALYAELEEERSASAIAANQTMAMITRLQEEKAKMQMEALQYQRMMEEQSEYDQEALQLLNELMVKREKEKQELEKELETCRRKVLEYETKERMSGMLKNSDEDELSADDLDCRMGDEENDNNDNDDSSDEVINLEEMTLECVRNMTMLGDSLTEFEEERLAILDQLKSLEEKLLVMQDVELSGNVASSSEGFQENYEISIREANEGSNGVSKNDVYFERLTMASMAKSLLPLLNATEDETEGGYVHNQQEESETHERQGSSVSNIDLEDKKLAIIEQVDTVYERLQALETDGEFLKHCIGSIKKGDKGMDLLQEILQHLRDLKAIEINETSIHEDELQA